jgi:hypothetical protein
VSNAIREGNPLSAGQCVHGVPMSQHCDGCEADEEPRTGLLNADYLKGFKDGQATLRLGGGRPFARRNQRTRHAPCARWGSEDRRIFQSSRIRFQKHQGLTAVKLQALDFPSNSGGVDGTRTRDPRRDRPMRQVSGHAGFHALANSNDWPNLAVSPLWSGRSSSNEFDRSSD